MANTTKNNKGLIIGVCAAVVAIIAIIVGIVLANNHPVLNDDYFVSDDTKYVISMDGDEITADDEYSPVKTHMVYFYSGDEITGLKMYYEFADEATAKAAYETYRDELPAEYTDIYVDGKYLVLTANASQYEGTSADDIKQTVEFLNTLNGIDLEDTSEDNEEEVIVDGETEEEEEVPEDEETTE
ncbi:hypothetical protein IJG89_02365 [Candidatus Saccharibacteria bacterium]|nr:hypothetical protein [Candidatus Saccharibacteria bacterium]